MFQILEKYFQVLQKKIMCAKIFQILNCRHLSHNINKLCFLMRPRLIYGDLNFSIGRTYKTFGKTRKTRWFCVEFVSVRIFDVRHSSFQYVTPLGLVSSKKKNINKFKKIFDGMQSSFQYVTLNLSYWAQPDVQSYFSDLYLLTKNLQYLRKKTIGFLMNCSAYFFPICHTARVFEFSLMSNLTFLKSDIDS